MMKGTERQIKWAEDIKANIEQYWTELETQYREQWDDPEGADEVRAEFNAVMQATAPYQDSAAWWIEEGKNLGRRDGVRFVMHRINTYPDTLTRYL
jgi:hypothetical protein